MAKLAKLVVTLCAIAICGCGLGRPTAEQGTPEWTIQSASIAAKQRDLDSYVRHFTPECHRDEIKTTLLFMMIHLPVREVGRREGPSSLKQVDAVLARENAVLKLLNTDWEWLAEIDSLPDDEQPAAIANFLDRVQSPDKIWIEILRQDSENAIWWGRIDSVSIDGDTAKVKTYAEDRDIFNVELDLRRIDGEWKIHPRNWSAKEGNDKDA